MSSFIKIALFSLLCISLSSCTKFGRNITVEGKVLNPITGKPYSGVEVQMIKSQNLKYYGGYKAFKHTFTDKNGHFELNATRLGAVWIQVQGDDYELGWDYNGKYYSMKKVEKGEVMHIDYHMVPYGKLRLNIKNINCEGNQDTMWLRKKWEYDDDFGTWPYVSQEGCYNKLTGAGKVPIGKYTYQIKVKRPSGTTSLYFNGTVHENQTTTIDVFY